MRGLGRSALAFASGTLLSRVTGALRDLALAALLPLAHLDLFILAFTIPNALRAFVAEGAAHQAFLPLYGRLDDAQAKRELLGRTLGCFLLLAGTLAVLMLLGASFVAASYGSGLEATARAELVRSVRYLAPYIVLLSWLALLSGTLIAEGRHGLAGALPACLNLGLVAVAWCLGAGKSPAETVWRLSIGIYLAAAIQLAASYLGLKQLGQLPRPRFTGNAQLLRPLLQLLIPTLGLSLLHQGAVFLTRSFAAAQATGSQSYLYLGQRLVDLPIALIGASLANALLPVMSRHMDADAARAGALLERALRLGALLGCLSALGAWWLGDSVVALLFVRGEFSAADGAALAASLRYQALMIPAALCLRLLAPAALAQKRPKWLLLGMAWQLTLYAALGFGWALRRDHVALAQASAWAVLGHALLLSFWVAWKSPRPLRASLRSAARGLPPLGVATLASFAATYLAAPHLPAGPLWRLLGLSVLLLASFGLVLSVLQPQWHRELRAALRRK